MRKLALALAALAAGAALVAAEPVPAPAQAAACSGTTGVTVVVDYGPLGGGVTVGCRLGDPPTGLQALQGAGFTVAGTQRWGLAFVCRINGKPTPAQDPCVNTPPATKYWSYWHASTHGAAWVFSSASASSYNPAPGSVEGWRYGNGVKPSITAP